MARKWMKNPSFGTVMLPSGRVLRDNEIIEGDQWAKNATLLGLIEVKTVQEPVKAAPQLLTDSQSGSNVKIIAEGDTSAAPPVETKPAAPTPPPAPPAPPVSKGTTSESIAGTSAGASKGKSKR